MTRDSNNRTSRKRQYAHKEVMVEFLTWLSIFWPDWQQNQNGELYEKLRIAYTAGWNAK